MNFHVLEWFDDGILQVVYKTYWEPIAYQLWFVRDMLFFIWLLPLIQYILRPVVLSKKATVMGIIAIWVAHVIFGMLVLWMAIGGLLAWGNIFDVTKIRSNRYWTLGCSGLFLALGVSHAANVLPDKLETLLVVVGIISVWSLYDFLAKGKVLCQNGIGKTLTGYTFFIYLIHIPLLLIFKKVPLLVNSSEPMLIACYLFVPLLFVCFSILLGMGLKKKCGKFYYLYTGGR